MEVTQTPTITTTTLPPAATASNQTASQITSDFQIFLQMLTAQMQYQDPLNPVDSTDYATQLATFSGVEQAVMTNDLLEKLTTQMTVGGLSEMASWVGRDARSTAPAYFDGQPVELYPKAADLADQTEIVVRNAVGQEVQRIPFAQGTDKITWEGIGAGGAPMPVGLYSFQVIGKIDDKVVTQAEVDVYSRINEVRLDGVGQTLLVLSGGATIPSDNVTALRDGLS